MDDRAINWDLVGEEVEAPAIQTPDEPEPADAATPLEEKPAPVQAPTEQVAPPVQPADPRAINWDTIEPNPDYDLNAPAPAAAPEHGAAVRGIVTGAVGAIEDAGEAASVFDRMSGGDANSRLGQIAGVIKSATEGGTGEYERKVPSFTDIGSLGDAGTYLVESVTSGIASSFPSLVTGAGGAVIGGAGGPAGAAVGGWAGAAVPAFVSGVGGASRDLASDPEIAKALKDGTVTQAQLDNYAVGTGALIGSLDALGAGKIINITGIGKQALKDATRTTLLAAVKKGIKEGVIAEGATEAAQQVLTEGAQVLLGGNLDLVQRTINVVDSFIQGSGTGGALGGAGGGYKHVTTPAEVPAAEAPANAPEVLPDPTQQEAAKVAEPPGVVRPATDTGQPTPGGLGVTPPPQPADAGTAVPPAEIVPQPVKEEIKRKTKQKLDGEQVTPSLVEPGAAAPDVAAALGGGPTTPVNVGQAQPLPSPVPPVVEEVTDELSPEDVEDLFSPEAKAAAVSRIREARAKGAIVAPANADIAAALAPAPAPAPVAPAVPQVAPPAPGVALAPAAPQEAITPPAGAIPPETVPAPPEAAMGQPAPVAPAAAPPVQPAPTPRSRFDILSQPAPAPAATVEAPAAPLAAPEPAPVQPQVAPSSPPAGAVREPMPEIIRLAPAPAQRAPVQEPAPVAEKPRPTRAQAAAVSLRDAARAAIGEEAAAVDVHAAVDQAVVEAIAALEPGAAPAAVVREHGESVTRRAREILAEKRGRVEVEEAAKTEEALARSRQQAKESAYAGKHKAKPKATIEREETRATERAAEKELQKPEPAPWAAKWLEANKARKAAKGRGKADIARVAARKEMAAAQAERIATTPEAAPEVSQRPAEVKREERQKTAETVLNPLLESTDLETPFRRTSTPFKLMREIVQNFVNKANAAFAKAGVTPTTSIQKTNTPVENLYVFAKRVLSKERGDMNPSDVYTVMLMTQRGGQANFDTAFDTMAESASLRGGISTEQIAAPSADETLERMEELERGDITSELEQIAEGAEFTDTGDLEAKLGKKPEHPAGVTPSRTMTAAEALTDLGAAAKVNRGFGSLTGAFNIFRKMHIKKLRQLVGDVKVHIVSQQEMQDLYAQRGRSPGGYVFGSYTNYSDADRAAGRKPAVYIDDVTAAADPETYANTLIHELTHAATSLAYRQNTNGTKDIVDRLFGSLKLQVSERLMAQGMTKEEAQAEMNGIYGLTSPTEFIAEAYSNPQFQQMLTQLKVPPRIASEIRALTHGRTTPTWWDAFVATVQNAVGMFHMGGASTDYFSATIAVHPSVMLSSKTQQFLAKRAAARISDKEHADSPIDIQPMLQKVANSGQAQYLKDRWAPERIRTRTRFKLATTMGLAEQGDRIFGTQDNPMRRLIELFLKKGSRRRKLIEPGEEMLGEMLRTHSPAEVREMTDVGYMMTEAQVDGRVPLSDPANKKHISEKGELDRWRRAAHKKSAEAWAKLTPAQQQTLNKLINHYQDLENQISQQTIKNMLLDMTERYANVTLPQGVTLEQAIDWVYDGAIDRKELERTQFDKDMHAALGKHAASLAGSQNMRRIKGVYLPMTRHGQYVISGVHEVKTPQGAVALTKDKHNNQFVFHDVKALRAYQDKTDDQISRVQSVWRDPATGERASPLEPSSVQEWVVTVQNRVFEMDDNKNVLVRAAEEYRKMGYAVTNVELRKDAFSTGTDILPRQLQRLLNSARQAQVNPGATGPSISQQGREAAIIDAYIRQLSGSRAQQRRLKRQNVKGYSRDLAASFSRHNRMMAGYLTNLEVDREMAKAEAELDKLRPEKLEYGKTESVDTLRLGDIRHEVGIRINGIEKAGYGDDKASKIVNAVTGMTFLTHLWSPTYSMVNAYQPIATSLPELGKKAGNLRAFRMLNKALGIMGAGNSAWAGIRDSISPKNIVGIFTGKQDFSRVKKAIGQYGEKGTIYDKVKGYKTQDGKAYGEVMAQAINALNEIGLGVDAGIETEIEQVGMNAVQRGLANSQHLARAMPQVVEAQNRYITAIASIHIDLDQGVSPEQAIRNAVQLVEKTQGGYEKENNPAIFSHPVGAVALQFKKYAVMYGNLFAQNVIDTFDKSLTKQERMVSLKAAATMMATTGVVAGAAGLPGMELAKFAVLGFYGATGMSDDDWDDTVGWLQGFLADMIGATPAEVITHGLPRLAGISLENRMGADSLVTFGSPESYDKADVMTWVFKNLSGAAVGSAFDAYGKMNEHKYDEMLTEFMPKWAADAYKGYKLGTEGDVTKTGRKKGEPYSIGDALRQTIGLQPAEKERRWEPGGGRYKEQQETKAKKRRSDTMGQWLNADKADRAAIWRDVIVPFNKGKKGKDKITKADLFKNLRRRQTEERKAAQEED